MVYCIPTQPIHSGIRYSVSVDGGPAQEVNLATAEFSKQWSENVLRGASVGDTTHPVTLAGKHTLTLRPLDSGAIFDKVVIDFGDLIPSYLGPPDTNLKP